MNPSQEPALPQRPDPTAAPAPSGADRPDSAAAPAPNSADQPDSGADPAGRPGPGTLAAGGTAQPGLPTSSADQPGSTDETSAASERPAPISPWAQPTAEGDGGYELAHPTGPGDQVPSEHAEAWSDAWEEPRPSRRPWRRTLVVAVLTGLVVFVLGGPLGLLWHWLAPSVPVLDAGSSGIVVNDPSPEEYIAADGWYTMLGLGFGLLVAIVAWLVMRKDRGPFLLLGVVLGTFGAGYLMGPWIGGLVGRGSYHHWEQTAAQGATYMAPPQVHSIGPRLVPAFAAAIVLTLLAGWSNDPDLDEPGAKPGQTPNTPESVPA